MKLIINNKEITASEQSMRSCRYNDYAGGRADALHIVFNDTYDLWKGWGLKKNDTIQVVKDRIDTGIMYVSSIGIEDGAYTVKALSTPSKALNELSNTRENIKLTGICSEISNELGFSLYTYEITDYLYEFVQRINCNSLEHLQSVLVKEGDIQKVYNNKLIIYSEKKLENKNPSIIISKKDFIKNPYFSTSDAKLVSSIENIYQHENGIIKTKVSSGLDGKHLILNIPVSSLGESERFCKNIMRFHNKYEFVGSGIVAYQGITAGITINLSGDFAEWSGTNFVYEVSNDILFDRQIIKYRKSIQGDY